MATVLNRDYQSKSYETFASMNDPMEPRNHRFDFEEPEEEKTEADQKCSELQINKFMMVSTMAQQPSMIVDQQPNSFYNYSISSITKSQIKPELYQLAFDVQNDLDEHDQQQLQFEQQQAERPEQCSAIREVKPTKPKQESATVVTSDPKNGKSKVVLSSNSIFRACSQPIVSKHFNAASLIMKNSGNNVSPICCCSVM